MGHRIPAWYCEECGEVKLRRPRRRNARSAEARICIRTRTYSTRGSRADSALLDDGWPADTETLRKFYPTSVLVTGFDIIFFWVARMIMFGLEAKHEVPFRDVYIHALVRDEKGQKMSKSRGNVIDPLTIVKDYGADALRLTLAALTVQGRDIFLSTERISTYRLFMNKLWNASRFALMNLEDAEAGQRNRRERASAPGQMDTQPHLAGLRGDDAAA